VKRGVEDDAKPRRKFLEERKRENLLQKVVVAGIHHGLRATLAYKPGLYFFLNSCEGGQLLYWAAAEEKWLAGFISG
jgi:hypothetical protein